MILETGDILLVSNRRMFEGDEPRFFLGRTITREGTLIKAEGYTFVRDLSNGHMVKKPEKRVKIMSLNSPGHIVYQLPHEICPDRIDVATGEGEAYLVDGTRRVLNLSERSHSGSF